MSSRTDLETSADKWFRRDVYIENEIRFGSIELNSVESSRDSAMVFTNRGEP